MKLSETVKAIIVVVLDAVAAMVLGFAEIFDWGLPWWGSVALIVAIVLDTWLGVQWVSPKKPSNTTGGTG